MGKKNQLDPSYAASFRHNHFFAPAAAGGFTTTAAGGFTTTAGIIAGALTLLGISDLPSLLLELILLPLCTRVLLLYSRHLGNVNLETRRRWDTAHIIATFVGSPLRSINGQCCNTQIPKGSRIHMLISFMNEQSHIFDE
jgi:hypothetical protein